MFTPKDAAPAADTDARMPAEAGAEETIEIL